MFFLRFFLGWKKMRFYITDDRYLLSVDPKRTKKNFWYAKINLDFCINIFPRGKFKNISENPRLNSSSNTSEATTNSNDEIMELRNEILELRQEIANIKNEMNNHKNTSSKSKSVSGFFSKLMSGMEQLGDDEDEYEDED